MAKFLSQVYTSIRGKVGGLVYTKNQFAGLIVRAFTAPTNPQTDMQTLIRSAFADASAGWEGMSQADRDAWDDYAATLEYSGPHGTYKLPGRQVFISNFGLARFIDEIGGATMSVGDSPPLVAGFENIGPVQPALYTPVSSTGVSVSVGNPNAYALAALVQRSIAYNLTKNTFDGPWLSDDNKGEDIALSATTTIDLDTSLGTAGQVIFVRVRCVTADEPHRITSEYIVRCIAVTNGP